jgi:hypothetical protein
MVQGARAGRFVFMYLGSFIGVVTYFTLCGRAAYSAVGVRNALSIALAVHTGYVLIARRYRELKQFDLGFFLLFALGTAAVWGGAAPVLFLFQHYSAALIPGTLGMVALIPLLLGREPFTLYFARRQVPSWQQRTPQFAVINRIMTAYWAVLFFIAAGLAAHAPTDWHFAALYPNLLLFGAGMTASLWLPPLYLRLFPPGLPDTAEALIMGMPFVFDPAAASDARATIQFRVSGAEPGSYYLHVERGRCESHEGIAPAADLTIETPDTLWLRIAAGEVDAASAFAEGLFRADGDLGLLVSMRAWFRTRG